MTAKLKMLERDIVACERCERLRAWCQEVARVKRRAYRDETYWGRPITGFGDAHARVYIVGLAPGAHGANRTGRVFTGDSSGDWLYRALHRAGFANQPASVHINDGLQLNGAWIGCAARCAPPDNKPTREELLTCSSYLQREFAALREARVIVALGRIAFDAALALTSSESRGFAFAHAAEHRVSASLTLISSYHPSRQNTQTGRLTEAMLDTVFARARELAY